MHCVSSFPYCFCTIELRFSEFYRDHLPVLSDFTRLSPSTKGKTWVSTSKAQDLNVKGDEGAP